jgi:hypothetical protein
MKPHGYQVTAQAPELWDLLGLMLSADKRQTERFTKTRSRGTGIDDDQVMGDVEEESDDV